MSQYHTVTAAFIVPPQGTPYITMAPILAKRITTDQLVTSDILSLTGVVDFNGASLINTPGVIPDPDAPAFYPPSVDIISNAVADILDYPTVLNAVYQLDIKVVMKNSI